MRFLFCLCFRLWFEKPNLLMVFANQQCSRTRERLPVMPILNRVDALNEDRLGKAVSDFAVLLTRAVKNVNAERRSGQRVRALAFGQ